MPLLILKTNLETKESVALMQPLFNLHPSIITWNVDTEDIDNVLRIESKPNLFESDIILLLNQYGIFSETLKN